MFSAFIFITKHGDQPLRSYFYCNGYVLRGSMNTEMNIASTYWRRLYKEISYVEN